MNKKLEICSYIYDYTWCADAFVSLEAPHIFFSVIGKARGYPTRKTAIEAAMRSFKKEEKIMAAKIKHDLRDFESTTMEINDD